MSRAHTRAALGLGIVSCALYGLTAPHGITWEHDGEDGAEFAAVGAVFGIPHPTGYPLYTLLLRLAVMVGGACGLDPARAATLLSALCGGAAVALLAWLLMDWLTRAGISGPGAWCGLVAAALFATTPNFWGQSNIIEVYALHTLFVALLLALAARWQGSTARLALLGYATGLGLTHHLTTGMLALPVLILVLRRGRLTARAILTAALALLAPLTLYAVLVLRSRLDPPLDWGNPESLRQLLWHVTGAQYQNRLFQADALEVGRRLMRVLGRHLPDQLGWVAWPLGLIGAAAFARRAGAMVAALLTLCVVQLAFVVNYSIPDPEAFYLPVLLAWSGLCAFGMAAVVEWSARRDAPAGRLAAWAPLLLLAWPLLRLPVVWRRVDLRHDTVAADYARAALDTLPRDALVVTDGDGRSFALWYEQARRKRFDAVLVYRSLLEWPWCLENLRRRYPALDVPEAGASVEQNQERLLVNALGHRPVFTTFSNRTLAHDFVQRPVGPLFRVEGVREPVSPPAGPGDESSPLPLGSVVNATYGFQAGAAGLSRDGLRWGDIRFVVEGVDAHTDRWAVVGFPGGTPGSTVRLPLRPVPTRALCLLVGGRDLGAATGALARVRVLAGADTLGAVDLVPFENVWDADAVLAGQQIPGELEALPGSSLSVVVVPLEEGPSPAVLEIEGTGSDSGAATGPGVVLLAVTQIIRR